MMDEGDAVGPGEGVRGRSEGGEKGDGYWEGGELGDAYGGEAGVVEGAGMEMEWMNGDSHFWERMEGF